MCSSSSCISSSRSLRRNIALPRPNWSRPLPRSLKIPSVMTLKTLADVRALMRHLPQHSRERNTWRHAADQLAEAARGGDVNDAVVALRLVLMLERVECWAIVRDPGGRCCQKAQAA
jgi:hypothetical protein